MDSVMLTFAVTPRLWIRSRNSACRLLAHGGCQLYQNDKTELCLFFPAGFAFDSVSVREAMILEKMVERSTWASGVFLCSGSPLGFKDMDTHDSETAGERGLASGSSRLRMSTWITSVSITFSPTSWQELRPGCGDRHFFGRMARSRHRPLIRAATSYNDGGPGEFHVRGAGWLHTHPEVARALFRSRRAPAKGQGPE